MNLKIVLSYDGSAYVGWQRQANGVSVQQRIEEVLKQIGGKPVVIHGASRTDTGVHALGMIASFQWTNLKLKPPILLRAMNALLTADIRILKIQKVHKKFHARFSAKRKLYWYRILNTPVADPFRRTTSWFIHKPLNLKEMKKAARYFVGKHDFSSVAVNPGYERSSMIRHIFRCAVLRCRDEIHVEVEGDGFLYKMVRTIVGTLVEVGLGKRTAESVHQLMKLQDRTKAGKTAPPQGLFLVKVTFQQPPSR